MKAAVAGSSKSPPAAVADHKTSCHGSLISLSGRAARGHNRAVIGGRAGMLEIRHLVKSFGPLVAVDDVSFTVPQGEVLGFLGPNGAGKSTTMKMITGFLAPTAGTAIGWGYDIATQPIAAKRHIGYLPEGAPAYPDMTPADFLDFIA